MHLEYVKSVKKIRGLDQRATAKFPLGYFIWGGVESRVRFYCSKLVDTDCESVEDIYLGEKNDSKVYLFTKTEENKLRPASGIFL